MGQGSVLLLPLEEQPRFVILGRTVLELVRDIATELAADGKRVKVCVQQALGQGVFQVGPRLSCDETTYTNRVDTFMYTPLPCATGFAAQPVRRAADNGEDGLG